MVHGNQTPNTKYASTLLGSWNLKNTPSDVIAHPANATTPSTTPSTFARSLGLATVGAGGGLGAKNVASVATAPTEARTIKIMSNRLWCASFGPSSVWRIANHN